MPDMTFTALDFETANNNFSSICQIGAVQFKDGEIVNEVNQYIDPQCDFGFMQQQIHGICREDINNKPIFSEYYPEFCDLINNQVIIHHQPFEWIALTEACKEFNLEMPNIFWLDNAKVVRRTWKQFSKKGYGLGNIANFLGYEFNHHDALEDARITGYIFIEACKLMDYGIEDWDKAIGRGINKRKRKLESSSQRLKGDILKPDFEKVINCNNPFFGKKVVISGTYHDWPDRKDLAVILKKLGADIDTSVNVNTNYLCAGKGAGPSKIKKMIKNINEGKHAKILFEEDIKTLLNGFI